MSDQVAIYVTERGKEANEGAVGSFWQAGFGIEVAVPENVGGGDQISLHPLLFCF